MDPSPDPTARPAGRRLRRGLLAFALGCVLALLLLEGALWIARAAHAPEELHRGPMGEGERTILCIGDSHTYGVHLESAQSYPGRLQALLERWSENPWRVVNVGYPGRNSAEVRARLADEIEAWKPEIVICWIGMNNTWSFAERQQWDSPLREVRPSALELRLQALRTPRLARMLWNKLAGESEEERVVTPARLRETLVIDWNRIRAICEERGVKLLTADYPVHIDYTERQVNGHLRSIAAALGIPLVSTYQELLPRFYALGYERTMLGDWHANEHGNYAIARRFLQELIALDWLEPRPEWTSAPPLEELVDDWPIRLVEVGRERALVLLSGPPHARYGLRLALTAGSGGDRTKREPVPSGWLAGLTPEELQRLGWRGELDGEGRARVALELPPAPDDLETLLGPGRFWLGWRLNVRMGTPEGELQLAPGMSSAEVLLDPSVVPPAR